MHRIAPIMGSRGAEEGGGRANVLRQRARSLAVEQRSYRNSPTFMGTNGIEGPLYTLRTTPNGH